MLPTKASTSNWKMTVSDVVYKYWRGYLYYWVSDLGYIYLVQSFMSGLLGGKKDEKWIFK